MGNKILSFLSGHLIDIGLEVSRDKIKDAIQEKQARERITNFIERQAKYNFSCSVEEEIDFGALAEYMQGDLIDDLRLRLCGTAAERTATHITITSKVKNFAKARTKLGEKRALTLVNKAIKILRAYYRSKTNSDLLFIAAEISEEIAETSKEQHTEQTQVLINEMTKQREITTSEITSLIQFSPEKAIAEGLSMLGGKESTLETLFTDFTNVLSTRHTLFPHYGYDFKLKNGKQVLNSVPLSSEAETLYPPKFKCMGTVRIGEKYVSEITPDLIHYVNRHQLPLVLNITQAQKLLGAKIDPVQHEADELVGKSLTIPPKPFRKAFPCTISINDKVEFDYILFRTQEILDDETIVVSNREQENSPFFFTMRTNLKTQRISFTISINDPTNNDILKYVRFMKDVEEGKIISVKSLELQEEFAKGRLDDFNYSSDFESIEEEVHFWEMVVAVENYFQTTIDTPKEIYDSEHNLLKYLYTLISGETNTVTWSSIAFKVEICEEFKAKIAEWNEEPFTLAYVGTVEVPLWGQKYEVPIMRRYLSVKPKNLERIMKKAEVLDIGEEIRLEFTPGEGEQGIWEDTLHEPNDNSTTN